MAFFRLLIAVVLGIAAVVAIVLGDKEIDGDKYPFRKVGFGLIAGSALFFLLSTLRIVSPGHVGIPVTFGKVGSQLGAGIHLTNPFAGVDEMSVRTENYTMSIAPTEGEKKGDDSVTVLGSDGGTGNADATVLFHLNKADASRVYGETGTDYVTKILRPTARTCIRDRFAQYPIVIDATSNREVLTTEIAACIEKEIAPKGITLETFQLRDVHLGETVQTSINAKIAAQQASEQQQFELSKSKQQAEIARVDAQGKADSQQIINCGGQVVADEKAAGGTKVVPRTGAECLNSLSPAYLQYLYIQSLQAMVNSPNHSTLILPFDQALTPLLNLNQQPTP